MKKGGPLAHPGGIVKGPASRYIVGGSSLGFGLQVGDHVGAGGGDQTGAGGGLTTTGAAGFFLAGAFLAGFFLAVVLRADDAIFFFFIAGFFLPAGFFFLAFFAGFFLAIEGSPCCRRDRPDRSLEPSCGKYDRQSGR